MSARLKNLKTRWKRIWINWYGRGKRRIEVATGQAVWYHTGKSPVPIRWVLVRDPLGKFKTRALLSTDQSLSAQKVIELYTRRWQVEVTFQECRAHLGFETQRQWNRKSIGRATPVVLALFSLVTLMAHRLQRRKPGSLRPRGARWYAKSQITFSDALAYVRSHLWQEAFCTSTTTSDSEKTQTELINSLAELLCYTQ